MKDKSVLIITLAMILLAFIASSMSMQPSVAGAITYYSSERNSDHCSEDLYLLNGKYVVPCIDGLLIWEEKYSAV